MAAPIRKEAAIGLGGLTAKNAKNAKHGGSFIKTTNLYELVRTRWMQYRPAKPKDKRRENIGTRCRFIRIIASLQHCNDKYKYYNFNYKYNMIKEIGGALFAVGLIAGIIIIKILRINDDRVMVSIAGMIILGLLLAVL